MAPAFPIRRSLVLLVCFLFAPAAAPAQPAGSAFVLNFGYARPYIGQPSEIRETFEGSFGLALSAVYAFRSQVEVGVGYELLSLDRQDPAEGPTEGGGSVQAISAVGGFASAPELPVQVFLHAGPALVLATDRAVRAPGSRDAVAGNGPGVTARLGLRVPLADDVHASAGGSVLVFSADGFARTFGTLQLGLSVRSPSHPPDPEAGSMRVLLVTVLLVVASVLQLGAQELRPGMRIRVANPLFVDGIQVGSLAGGTYEGSGTGWQVGDLVAMDSSSITLETASGEIVTMPRDHLTRLEVSSAPMDASEGAWRGARTGAGVGLLIGAGFLGFRRATTQGVTDDLMIDPRNTGHVVATLGVGTLIGTGLGYLYGSRVRERWEAVDAPRMSASVDASGGTRVGITLRF